MTSASSGVLSGTDSRRAWLDLVRQGRIYSFFQLCMYETILLSLLPKLPESIIAAAVVAYIVILLSRDLI